MSAPELILTNGKVYSVTLDDEIIRGEAVAVKDGKISQTDIDASVRRIVYCKLQNITDLAQREKLYQQFIKH